MSSKSCKLNNFKEIVKLGRVGTDSIHRGAEKNVRTCERETVSARITDQLSDGEKKIGKSKGRVSSKKNYQAMFKFQV